MPQAPLEVRKLRAESACRQKAEHDEEHQHDHLHDHERRLRSGRRQLVQEGQFGEGLSAIKLSATWI